MRNSHTISRKTSYVNQYFSKMHSAQTDPEHNITFRNTWFHVVCFVSPSQSTRSAVRCILCAASVPVCSSHSSRWWFRFPATRTVNLATASLRSVRDPPTLTATPATLIQTGTRTRTYRPDGTGASSARSTQTSSLQRRSWSERRGWRRESGSYGKSGWTDSRTSQEPAAWIATTKAPPPIGHIQTGSYWQDAKAAGVIA